MSAVTAGVRISFREAYSNRVGFWSQIVVMSVNDAAWILFWRLLFHRVGLIKGWDADRVTLLWAVGTAAIGLSSGVFGNLRRMGTLIANGSLDPLLTLPARPLSLFLVRRVNPLGLGDAVFGLLLFLSMCHPTPTRFMVYVLVVVAGAVVFTSFLVILSSLTFFMGGNGDHVALGFDLTTIVSMYPLDLYGGLMRLAVFTVIPVAFMTAIPTSLIDNFSYVQAGLLAAAATGAAVMARVVFDLGLRRYRSGSLWVRL